MANQAAPPAVRALDTDRGVTCALILRALPDWFGIEESTAHYIREVEDLDCFAAYDGDRPVGFLALKPHSAWSIELFVMGVLPAYHRTGVGRALLATAETAARASGHGMLLVETLGPSHPDPGYAATRRFYEAAGFQGLKEYADMYQRANPILLMLKPLGPA